MKNLIKNIKKVCAVSVCAVMMLAGCSDNGGTDTGTGKPETARIVKSTGAGNSGTVTLQQGDTYAVISVKDYGDITLRLYPEEAPYAVYNFTELAKAGTYNGRTIHRVISDFMIQGGSASGTGTGGDSFDGGTFRCEVNTSMRHYYGALCMASAGGNQSDQFYIVNNNQPLTNADEIYEEYVSGTEQQIQVMDMYLAQIDKNDESMKMYYDYYSTQKQFYTDYNNGIKAMQETVTDAVKQTYSDKGGVAFLDGGYTVFGQTVDGFDVIDAISACEKVDDGMGNISKPATDIIIEKVEIFTK